MIKPFLDSFFGKAVVTMTVADAAATLALLFWGRSGWLAGMWGSAAWFWLNAFLMWRLTAWASSGTPLDRGRVIRWSIVKFPALYLIGAGFLLIPGVSLYGVLITFSVFLAGLAVAMCMHKG